MKHEAAETPGGRFRQGAFPGAVAPEVGKAGELPLGQKPMLAKGP